ncbi:Heat shock 70 kDa protein [Dendrobium catenatum]|uniref:Heat shock 70 kDa protein n=1 Tax=Dendrobium catenatum TaxID=906689 RepID=A0A2I0VP02_9ASPA|nr:Heat shock 70 kDa protein [Dendrobium catenatum]
MERLGHRAQNFVAIIPASSNTSRYQSQLSAGATAAGIRILFFIEAPVLAASYYKSHTPGHRTVLVFDLDVHIFEVSLLTEDENLKVKAAVSDLGCPLFNYMVSEIQRKLGIDISGDATSSVASDSPANAPRTPSVRAWLVWSLSLGNKAGRCQYGLLEKGWCC